MTPVVLPEKYPYATFASRGIEAWKAERSRDGASLTCSFRAKSGSDTLYGGLGIPISGSKAFGLTVTFTKGASAVRSVFVTALGPKGEEVSQWGYGVEKGGQKLSDNQAYAWQFVPNQPIGNQFWVKLARLRIAASSISSSTLRAVRRWISKSPR